MGEEEQWGLIQKIQEESDTGESLYGRWEKENMIIIRAEIWGKDV